MKKYIKNLFISSLLLMSPSLMAVTPSDTLLSQGYYCSDFNAVSLERANDSEYNNLYKLTVDNNGSNFISHYGIRVFEMNESGEDIKKSIGEFACINTDDYSKLFSDRLIRPGETSSIYFQCGEDLLQEGKKLKYQLASYQCSNDVVSASGPFTVSLEEEAGFKYLGFDFNVTELTNVSEALGGVPYKYGYIATFDYDGKTICSFLNRQLSNGKLALMLRQDSDKIQELDLGKLTVKNIDVFIIEAFYEMDCIAEEGGENKSNKTVRTVIIVLSAVGGVAVAAITVALFVPSKKKANAKK